jgi:cellulose synthase operon protein C
MAEQRHILSGLIAFGLFWGAASAGAQSVIDDNRTAAGYYSRQEWAESILAFKELIQRHPHTLEATAAQFYLGEAYMQTDDFQNAYRAFQQYLLKHATSELSGRATFRMAEAAYYMQNDATAIRLMESFVEQYPEDPLNEFALPYLGDMRLRKTEPQLAARVFERALRQYPQGRLSKRCILGLARASHLLGRFQDAIDHYHKIADDLEDPQSADAHIQMALIFMGQSETETARRHLDHARQKAQDETQKVEASYWLARTYIHENDIESAFTTLEPMVGKSGAEKTVTGVTLDAAVLGVKLGHTEKAFCWLQDLLDRYPGSSMADAALNLQLEIAQGSAQPKTRDQTLALIDRFLKEHSQSRFRPNVLEKAGRFHYAHQNYHQAAETFEQLLDEQRFVDPQRIQTDLNNWLYLCALSHIGQRDFVAAEANLGKINFASASEEIRILGPFALATARFGQKKYHTAIPGFASYLKESKSLPSPDPGNLLTAYQELTIAYAETGQWAEALQAFGELQAQHPGDAAVHQIAEYLASRAMEKEQNETASQLLERLVISGCESEKLPMYLSSLGWLKYESGDTVQAIELFRRLIDEFPESELTGPAAMALAKSFDDAKQHDRAAQMYGWVIRNFDQKDFGKIARLRRAHSLLHSGVAVDLEEAKLLLNEYLSFQSPVTTKDEALYQLGWVHLELGEKREGKIAFRRLVEEFPESKYRLDAALRSAQMDVAENNFDQARQALAAISNESDLPPPIRVRKRFLLGEIGAKTGDWSSVSDYMMELLDDIDDLSAKVKATYWLGEASFRQSKYEQAADHFRFVREHRQALSPDLHPWIWLRLVQSLGQMEQWPDVQEVAEEGLAQFENFALVYEFHFLKARSLEDTGRLSDARELYQKVIDSPQGCDTETAAIAQWRIGETYFHQENYAQAIKAYYLVDSQFGYDHWRGAALLQAGKCQEHLLNWPQAEKLYTRLIQQFPDSAYRSTAEERLKKIRESEFTRFSNTESKTRPLKSASTIR